MKYCLVVLLVLHALIEGLMGAVMVVAPQTLAPTAGPSELGMMTTYGFAAITMALAVAWLWPQRHQLAALSVILGLLATFHTCLSVAIIMLAINGAAIATVFIHLALAGGFWFLWLRRNSLVS